MFVKYVCKKQAVHAFALKELEIEKIKNCKGG